MTLKKDNNILVLKLLVFIYYDLDNTGTEFTKSRTTLSQKGNEPFIRFIGSVSVSNF